MTSQELVARVLDIARHYKTLYVRGCFGTPLTKANKERYIAHHSYNRKKTRAAKIRAASEDTFGFDCVCLIKGVLWGWTGDRSKSYGGARYAVNGVPDIDADTMIRKCPDASASGWAKIEPGEVVWCSGHIGVYIGDGLAVECSPAWANGVQVTAVGNIGRKSGYNTRSWQKHGHLPYVSYGKTATVTQEPVKQETAQKDVRAKGVAAAYDKSIAGTYRVQAAAGLNARDEASLSGKVLVTIPNGTEVRCYGYYSAVGGRKWLYVVFDHRGVTYRAFCAGEYLRK